jgi:hypothetical protein
MRRRVTILAAIVALGVLVGSLAWAITADQVTKRIANKINSKWRTQRLQVSVAPYSDAETAKGRFRRIGVTAASVVVDGVKLAPVTINATDVTLDLSQLVTKNQVVCKRRQSGHFATRCTEVDLNRALAHKHTPIENLHVTLGAGTLVFTGTYRIGFGANLRLEGVLECKDHYQVNFVPTRASVSGVPLPTGPLKTVLAKINPLLDFRKVPLSPRVDRISVQSGYVALSG